MKVQFSRPHIGGSHTGIGDDIKVVEQDDDAPVPEGGTVVDPATPVQDWTYGLTAGAGLGARNASAIGKVN